MAITFLVFGFMRNQYQIRNQRIGARRINYNMTGKNSNFFRIPIQKWGNLHFYKYFFKFFIRSNYTSIDAPDCADHESGISFA
jgi:hypothetical protein